MPDLPRLQQAYETVRAELLAARVEAGHWVGELSTSALSTATAISALSLATVAPASRSATVGSPGPATSSDPNARCDPNTPSSGSRGVAATPIRRGIEWLAACQNADGGWGDTDRSLSNIATTMLVRAAFTIAGESSRHEAMLDRAGDYVVRQGGLDGLRRRYGKDKTFAVPILTNAALAGLESWDDVAGLPFELACLPQALLGAIRLPVVSYAIPALVAIGQARFYHRAPRNPVVRWIRRLAAAPSLRVLARMQPESGGYLEATPLTSFVVMSLASIGHAEHPVCRRGVDFLLASVRPDGSWPIDTNLATWATTLSINALAGDPTLRADLSASSAADPSAGGVSDPLVGCLDWLLWCQHRKTHPFTAAAPGGWGWTDLSGAVPDADDTAGALLALAALYPRVDVAGRHRIVEAAKAGLKWLLDLQNRDGGWPTFCRGWGALPFDRSGVDLTAHALRALAAWREHTPANADSVGRPALNGAAGRGPADVSVEGHRRQIELAIHRGFRFLTKTQQADGRWSPLWFGNQYQPDEDNPCYGTARTLLAYRDLGRVDAPEALRARDWLLRQSGADGGWGYGPPDAQGRVTGQPSVEETAVSVEALLPWWGDSESQLIIEKGLRWLIEAVQSGQHRRASPIGLYFARLWYHERVYPLAFTAGTLSRALGLASPMGGLRIV